MIEHRDINHFHLFCGLGGGAAGFNAASARVGNLHGRFRCLGGIDSDPAAIEDFGRLAGVPGTVLDLFDRSQYLAWHGHEPPADWREATPDDIRRAAGNERPHIVFTSPPCKGFSGLLGKKHASTAKYQALNALTLRGILLALEAWRDDPPEFFLLENVPRIQTRGAHFLEQIEGLLRSYGYATAQTTHDCGELGGLAQSRKRFLLVARHVAKVPPFLYEPGKKPLRGVGSVLERFPMPGDTLAGAMHRVPNLQFKTWLRLAFVPAGKDWRALNDLRVTDGVLADYALAPETDYHGGVYGVLPWDQPTGTIAGRNTPTNGAFSVADPRPEEGVNCSYSQYGVQAWQDSCATITGQRSPGQGRFTIADPRPNLNPCTHHNIYRVVPWDHASKTVSGATHVAGGAASVADPRQPGQPFAKYTVTHFDAPSGTVISGSTAGQGAFAVADPRIPEPTDRLVAVIRSLDDTWHRPFTTLELAALQGLVDPDEHMEFAGLSDSAWRERIGNAVPKHTAAAIASVMGTTLLLAMTGETFVLGSTPIWVRPVAVALSVDMGIRP